MQETLDFIKERLKDVKKKKGVELFHKAKNLGVVLKMAHSLGDVLIGQSSFLCVLMGKNRKNAL
ncbi:hypothetical protein BZK24_08560, partial [Helicobacter pylori]